MGHLKRTGDWKRISVGSFRGVRCVEISDFAIRNIVSTLPDLQLGRAGNLIRHAQIDTGRYAWQYHLEGEGVFFLKYYADLNSVKGRFRKIKTIRQAERAFKHHLELRDVKIPVPKPLLFLRRKGWGFFQPALLVTQWLDGYETLHEHCFNKFLRHFDSDGGNDILSQIMVVIASLHVKGFIHGDLNPYNILVKRDAFDPDKYQIYLTDFDYVKKRYLRNINRRMMDDICTLGAMLHNVIPENDAKQNLIFYFSLMSMNSKDKNKMMLYCCMKYHRYIRLFQQRFKKVSDSFFAQAEDYIRTR